MVETDSLKEIEHYAQALKAPAFENRQQDWRSRPAATDGVTRTISPRCCREKSRRGNRPARRPGSDLPDFRRENHWRSSTSTINRPSVEKWWRIREPGCS